MLAGSSLLLSGGLSKEQRNFSVVSEASVAQSTLCHAEVDADHRSRRRTAAAAVSEEEHGRIEPPGIEEPSIVALRRMPASVMEPRSSDHSPDEMELLRF